MEAGPNDSSIITALIIMLLFWKGTVASSLLRESQEDEDGQLLVVPGRLLTQTPWPPKTKNGRLIRSGHHITKETILLWEGCGLALIYARTGWVALQRASSTKGTMVLLTQLLVKLSPAVTFIEAALPSLEGSNISKKAVERETAHNCLETVGLNGSNR